MEEKDKLGTRIKDFFIFQKLWLSKFINIFIVAILTGLISGFMIVLFNYMLLLFKISFSLIPYFISPIIAGSLTSLLVKFGKFERVMGTGAAEFVEEINLKRTNYKRTSNLIAKTIATSWTYGSGMICGIEGPGILIGGNIGNLVSKRFKINEEDEIFVGASACTGAILKAPISGALFCAELPYNNHIKYQPLIPSIIASTIAYLIFCSFFDFSPLINTNLSSFIIDGFNFVFLLPLFLIFGIIMGFIVLLFIGLLRGFTSKTSSLFQKKSKIWLLPLVGALIYGFFLFIIVPLINIDYRSPFINPDPTFLSLISVNINSLDWIFFLTFSLLIFIAILLFIGTMNSAGIIFPLMLFGALNGGLFGVIFYPSNPELFMLLGISTVLGAATNNPIAAIFMIIEMTWVPFLFIPAGITTIIAYIFSGPNAIIPGQRNIQIFNHND